MLRYSLSVSKTPAANFATGTAGVNDTCGKQCQAAYNVKVNLKAKIYLYVNSSTQRNLNKIIKFFWLKTFATGVTDTGGAPWAANISTNKIKNWDGPNGILMRLGETSSSSIIYWVLRADLHFYMKAFRQVENIGQFTKDYERRETEVENLVALSH